MLQGNEKCHFVFCSSSRESAYPPILSLIVKSLGELHKTAKLQCEHIHGLSRKLEFPFHVSKQRQEMLFFQLSLAEKADAVSSHSGSGWVSVRVRSGEAAGAAPDFSAGGGLTVTELGAVQVLLGWGSQGK